jgi:hypothetical protein
MLFGGMGRDDIFVPHSMACFLQCIVRLVNFQPEQYNAGNIGSIGKELAGYNLTAFLFRI